MNDTTFVTSETDFAAYLIVSGMNLIHIQYEPRSNGRKRGLFVFEGDERIEDFKNQFEAGQISINLQDYKKTRIDLLDRIMQEKP
jgi:hypothetical protein